MNRTNKEEQQGNNTEMRTRSGRISRRPKLFEDYETFQKKGIVMMLNFLNINMTHDES